MTVWFTADLHIGHAKVAAMRATNFMITRMFQVVDGEMIFDPEHDIRWHDQTLASYWDNAIRPDDIVWVLGDISAGGRATQLRALEWIKDRPGIKHLIAGNHDACHPMHRDSHKWQRIYLEAFGSVQMAARRRINTLEGSHTVLLSHFPYEGDHGIDRYPEWRLKDGGNIVLHGHTHSSEKLSSGGNINRILPNEPNQIHVGVDAWNLKPVSLEQIGELL